MYLTSSTVHGLKSNWIDTEGRIEAYTDFNRLYLDHCWTTGSLQLGVQLNTAESRTGFGILLPFTVKELMGNGDGTELQQDLWHALQRTGWTLHPHCESAGTDA